jgi:hypothetical protein
MAEAAARYARHLNTFRARSKAQLAQKVRWEETSQGHCSPATRWPCPSPPLVFNAQALAFVGVFKNHYHEVSKAMRSFDKDLLRAETGLEQFLAQDDALEKVETEEIEKVGWCRCASSFHSTFFPHAHGRPHFFSPTIM